MELKRVLTSVDATWLVAGAMIGSGIFITPGLVAQHLPSAGWILFAWLLGGVVSLCGAAVYGELGARLPEAGGDYRYLTTAYGPLWGFMNGWAAITLTFSAAAAAQTRSALEYARAAVPALAEAPDGFILVAAPLTIALLTAANAVGARIGGKATALFTALPLLTLMILFGYGALAGGAEIRLRAAAPPAAEFSWFSALGVAMVPIFFTYSGWNAAAYMGGEMRRPARSLALGLAVGTGLVTLFYMLVNLGLLLVLSPQELAGSARPAADAAERLLGGSGERLLTATIAVAILGSANVTLMAGARVYYAMALDGLAPARLSATNTSGVPSTALWVGGAWSALLAIIGDIGDLVDWATLAILLLSSMTVSSLFVLRRRDSGKVAFLCPGYPLTPIVFLVTVLGVAVSSYFYDPVHALIGLAIIAAGFPIYFVARRSFTRPFDPQVR